jgi:redox-sensitive bicupin YhaK (pirin superfamily)
MTMSDRVVARGTSGPSIQLRRADERGHADHGWLNAYHTFSFADYYDEAHMGFRALRVINEDRVQPGQGFGMHGHRDMEIITYILEGELAHKDSMGNASTIRPGELQRMSAGTGVRHSEVNPSNDKLVHLLQIWFLPERQGIAPSYEQKECPRAERTGQLRLVASRDGRAGSLTVHQDVHLFSSILEPGQVVEDRLRAERYGWLQVARGTLMLNGELLAAGDSAAISGGGPIELKAPVGGSGCEILLFDLA